MPTDNGSDTIQSYSVYWDQGLGTATYVALASTDAFTLSFVKSTGLTTGTAYSFKISAHNSVGESDKSSPALTVIAAKVPDTPTNVALVSATSAYIEFSWAAPYNGGSPIISYLVFWDSGLNGAFTSVAFTQPNVVLYRQDYGLTPGSSYKFYVVARNAVGDSPASTTKTFVAASVPSAPGQPYATSADKTSISIAWTAANNNGTPLTNYRLY